MQKTNRETVLVTGASSGIGWELAICFAAEGCRMILVARNTAALEALAEQLRRDHGVEVIVLAADLAQPESPQRLFAELQSRSLTVDVLVNNAGFGANGTIAELAVARQTEMVQVNITALLELTKLFLPGMITRNQGGILNVGSTAGFQPGPGMAVYFATKAFVNSFTEALGEELRSTNVKISVLCPGATESNFWKVARGEKPQRHTPMKMTSRAVAEIGHRAFRRGKLTIITGGINQFMVFIQRLTPRSLPRKVAGYFNKVN